LANTLLEGMACIEIPGNCWRVLFWVIRESYGYHRKNTAKVSRRAIGKMIGMHNSSVDLAVKALLAKGLIKSVDGGCLMLVKDAFPLPSGLGTPPSGLGTSAYSTRHPLPSGLGSPNEIFLKKEEKESKYRQFCAFFSEYPVQENRERAWKEWEKINPPLKDCLIALAWQKDSDRWKSNGGQYVPSPAKWISNKRWQDIAPNHNFIFCPACSHVGSITKNYKGKITCGKCGAEVKSI